MSRQLRAHFALAAVALIYGANYLIAKSVMPDPIGANSFIVLRVLGAALIFWMIAARQFRWPDKEDLGRFILCGLTGVAINQLFFFNGLSLTSPINSAIIMTSNPILVMLISAVMVGHRITPIKVTGVVLGAAGAIALLLLSNMGNHPGVNLTGDIYILLNSISYAFYLVLVKPLMMKYHPLLVIAWVFTIGLVFVLPFGAWSASQVPWSSLDSWQWFSVFYVIVFTTFLTYLLNILALHILTPSIASAYIYFQPLLAGVFSFLFSIWLQKDYTGDITWGKAACTALIFAGVYLVSKADASNLKSK
jgi:drug/metabolite transporter (DMT)-like permease